jgi:hypothetical protein
MLTGMVAPAKMSRKNLGAEHDESGSKIPEF